MSESAETAQRRMIDSLRKQMRREGYKCSLNPPYSVVNGKRRNDRMSGLVQLRAQKASQVHLYWVEGYTPVKRKRDMQLSSIETKVKIARMSLGLAAVIENQKARIESHQHLHIVDIPQYEVSDLERFCKHLGDMELPYLANGDTRNKNLIIYSNGSVIYDSSRFLRPVART